MENTKAVPHLGQVNVNAIVYKQMPDGQFSPQAVWYDSLQFNFLEESPEKCIDKLKQMIKELREKDGSTTKSN